MSNDDPSTIAGIWLELREHRDMLVRMETKLENVSATLPDHETRLRKLEERRFPLQTMAILASVASILMSVVLYVITSH